MGCEEIKLHKLTENFLKTELFKNRLMQKKSNKKESKEHFKSALISGQEEIVLFMLSEIAGIFSDHDYSWLESKFFLHRALLPNLSKIDFNVLFQVDLLAFLDESFSNQSIELIPIIIQTLASDMFPELIVIAINHDYFDVAEEYLDLNVKIPEDQSGYLLYKTWMSNNKHLLPKLIKNGASVHEALDSYVHEQEFYLNSLDTDFLLYLINCSELETVVLSDFAQYCSLSHPKVAIRAVELIGNNPSVLKESWPRAIYSDCKELYTMYIDYNVPLEHERDYLYSSVLFAELMKSRDIVFVSYLINVVSNQVFYNMDDYDREEFDELAIWLLRLGETGLIEKLIENSGVADYFYSFNSDVSSIVLAVQARNIN